MPPTGNAAAEWHQRFARYYEDVLRAYAQTSSRSLTGLAGLFARQVAGDLGVLGQELDGCLDVDSLVLDVRMERGDEYVVESDEVEEFQADQAELELASDQQQVDKVDRRQPEVRAARKIHRTQTQDPYNRETVIGGPILLLNKGKSKLSGPLLYWEVDITYDPGLKRITVTKRTEAPELNTMLLDSSHRSVGASTAVFAALGLLAGFVWRARLMSQERWPYRLGPVIGGIALLAFTGTGDENTDIGAHLAGFLCGFATGTALTLAAERLANPLLQKLAGAASLALLVAAWFAALR